MTKCFNDLDKFRDYCRFEGKVFNEKDLYKIRRYCLGSLSKSTKAGFVQKHVMVSKRLCNPTEKIMTIHIVDIEAVDTRYTKQWKEHLPKQLRRATNDARCCYQRWRYVPQATTPGAFLNFGRNKRITSLNKC